MTGVGFVLELKVTRKKSAGGQRTPKCEFEATRLFLSKVALYVQRRYCASKLYLTRVPVCDPSVFRFSPDAGIIYRFQNSPFWVQE